MAGSIDLCPACNVYPCSGCTAKCETARYFAQNPTAHSTVVLPGAWPTMYLDPGFKYDTDASAPWEDTQPGFGFVPTAPAKCECGSGSDALSGAHSHWCRRYLAP